MHCICKMAHRNISHQLYFTSVLMILAQFCPLDDSDGCGKYKPLRLLPDNSCAAGTVQT